ncbi:MAG TPA: DUF1295 domain-containing protein [Bacteroidales bacterium]|nr:DUF1295 domain-containing protein [Bacteroidales bacterium]HPS62802.1 DUF1295 domain-containing protein [Bacteroidales bacterium]
MKILPIAILLGITLLAVPVISYFTGTALGPAEWETLYILGWICIAAIVYCFLVGELTGNNSQVDKLWSLLPVLYTWVVAAQGSFAPRLVLMAALVTVWGIRLTANFARKGAYSWRFWAGEEDYRWVVLRQKPEFQPRWKWTLFNLFFISGYQNILILLFTLPTVVALQHAPASLGSGDLFITALMLFFILFETIADIQQWRFQRAKHQMIASEKELTGEYKRGFLSKGLWSLSRHPNYFAEQAIWISFYGFSVAAGGPVFNWSIAGCLLLVVLFQGSSAFSEEISAGKYPEYAQYQREVNRFLPVKRRKS